MEFHLTGAKVIFDLLTSLYFIVISLEDNKFKNNF